MSIPKVGDVCDFYPQPGDPLHTGEGPLKAEVSFVAGSDPVYVTLTVICGPGLTAGRKSIRWIHRDYENDRIRPYATEVL